MKKIGLICKDAGSGFFLSQMCKKNKNKYLYFLKQPALNIFKNEIGNFRNNLKLKKLNNVDKIISGTGKTNFEKNIIHRFIKKKFIVVYVDHWVNFKNRFTYKNFFLAPSEIWVSDRKTLNLSKNYFPKITKTFSLNIKNKIIKKQNKSVSFLYLLGSLNKNKLDNKLTKTIKNLEKKSFEKFILFVKKNKIYEKNISIKIRIHPEEKNKVFIKKKLKKLKNITMSKSNLIDEINISTHVFGANSTSIIIAEKLKKKLIICLDKDNEIFNSYKSFKLIKNFKINEN